MISLNQQASDHHFYTAHESISLRSIQIFIRKKYIYNIKKYIILIYNTYVWNLVFNKKKQKILISKANLISDWKFLFI